MSKIDEKEYELLRQIREHLPLIRKELNELSEDLSLTDALYRLYHHSYKAAALQNYARSSVGILEKLTPNGMSFCTLFSEIINQVPKGRIRDFGEGLIFPESILIPESNEELTSGGRKWAEAVFHSKFF